MLVVMHRVGFIVLAFLTFSCNNSKQTKLKESTIAVLSSAIKKDPNNQALLLERADYNKKMNNFESALFDLKRCVLLDSLDFSLQYKIAEVYFELSKLPGASQKHPGLARYHLEKALNINPADYKSLSLLGELLLAYGEYKEARDKLNESINLVYNQPRTHMLLGYTFRKLKKDKQAINAFRDAIDINHQYKEAYIQLAQIFHKKKDTLAITYYDHALSIDSMDELVLYNKAVFYQSLLKWNKALETYAALHRVSPFHAEGHYNLGFIHMELGMHDIASNNFSDAIYSNSEFFEAYYSRGICFETLGNIRQALSDYKRAITINPNYTFAINALNNLKNKNDQYNTQ